MFVFFFFSSRRRHTRYIGDWSSDVCSSDLPTAPATRPSPVPSPASWPATTSSQATAVRLEKRWPRSEERRVGKECRSRWWRCDQKKKKNRDGGREEQCTQE